MTIPLADEWLPIQSREDMPKDRQFLVTWKSCIHLAEYDEDIDRFFIVTLPAQFNSGPVDAESEKKLRFWRDLPYNPEHDNPDRSLKDD